ncbi:MAG: hypothetical protein QXH90_04920 [Candidatus Korarchaeum sp.]
MRPEDSDELPEFALYYGGRHIYESEEEPEGSGGAPDKVKVTMVLLGICFPIILIAYLIYKLISRSLKNR